MGTPASNLAKARDPWARLPDEPYAAYVHFIEFRESPPPRNLRKYSEMPGVDIGLNQSKRLCATYGWIARADAWAEFMQGRRDVQTIHEAEIGARLRQKALDDALELTTKGFVFMLDNPETMESVSFKDYTQALERITKELRAEEELQQRRLGLEADQIVHVIHTLVSDVGDQQALIRELEQPRSLTAGNGAGAIEGSVSGESDELSREADGVLSADFEVLPVEQAEGDTGEHSGQSED